MKIITLLNEKGGIGRTTMATHLAAGLAIAGAKVVLVDTDMQGNATEFLGNPLEPGIYNLMAREDVTVQKVIRPVSKLRYAPRGDVDTIEGALYLIPSNDESRHIASVIQDHIERFYVKMMQLDGVIDYIVVDTSPMATLFHTSIYLATTDILFPTRLEKWSLEGLANVFRRRETASRLRSGYGLSEINTLGIAPTMTKMRTVLHQENLNRIANDYAGTRIFNPIASRTAWAECADFGQLMYAYDFDGEAMAEFMPLLQTVMETT